MSEKPDAISFPVDQRLLGRYIFWHIFWIAFWILGGATIGLGLPVWLIFVVAILPWYSHAFKNFYKASLEPKRIRINHGVIFQKRKAIPLDRVTDVLISQGYIERRMGICQIRIQTAGTGNQGTAEGVIYALPIDQAEEIQEQIIEARDRYSERSAE